MRTTGMSTEGKRSTPRLRNRDAHDHEGQNNHHREDRTADADFSKLLHEGYRGLR